MDYFEEAWRDDNGILYEVAYYVTKKGYFYWKFRINGHEQKARRISEAAYTSAYEGIKNY